MHRSSRWEKDKWAERGSGSSSAGKRGLYTDRQGEDLYTDSADFGGVGLILSKDWQGMGQGWGITAQR